MKHVLFDFDDTLDRIDVQDYAKTLLKRNDITIWICTARMEPKRAPSPRWNSDLFQVAKEFNIPHNRIIFTNEFSKVSYLRDYYDINFVWLLDDDWDTCDKLNNSDLNIKGIKSRFNSTWKQECNELL